VRVPTVFGRPHWTDLEIGGFALSVGAAAPGPRGSWRAGDDVASSLLEPGLAPYCTSWMVSLADASSYQAIATRSAS
jgi:hypothetical protein